MFRFITSKILVATVAFLYSGIVAAQSLTVPAGTPVYGELDQSVSSKKRKTTVGDIIRAHAWRNVVVDGKVVIKAGAPMVVRVSHVKGAKVAGIKGDLELEAVSVRAADGTDIMLDGGYDKSGKGRKALTITLFLLVAWPLIFIKGKQAKLDSGTVFDCAVQADAVVKTSTFAPIRVRLGDSADLTVEPLYDEMDPEGKQETLPVKLRLCGNEIRSASVVTVNGQGIPPLELVLGEKESEGGCDVVRGTINLKKLTKHFRKGINRFEIEASGVRAEVVIDVEL